MADIPLKSDDEMTNDLVGAVENIAQSVKAGSRDFTKSFNGLTAAIKRLQTTLVNAIKSIKVQVVTKPEKTAKQPTKVKETSTKEVVKEKETRTEVKPEPKAKALKKDPNVVLDEKVLKYISKNPESSGGRIEKDIGSGEGTLSSPELKNSLERLIKENKILEDSIGGSSIRMYSVNPNFKPSEKTQKEETKSKEKNPETKTEVKPEPKTKVPKIEKVIDPAEAAKKEKKNKIADESAELRLQTQRNNAQLSALRLQRALTPKPEKKAPPKEKTKPVDPQEKERLAKEKAREKEIEKRQEKVKPVRISSLIEGINQTGDAWSKMISGVRNTVADIDNARKEEEKQVAKTGKEGTKEFVGPPQKLFIGQQNKEKQEKDKYEKEVQERQRKLKPVNVSSLITGINQVGDAWSKVISNVKNSVEQQAKIKEQEEKNVIESGNEKSKKFVGPLKKDFEENERKKALPSGPEFVGPSKDLFNTDQKRQKDEEEVKKLGKEGTKSFVGPPKKLFENDEKAVADAVAQAIADAAEQAADDAKKALERKNKAEEEAAKAEKVLRDYFRKKAEKEAQESSKAAEDFIKQQQQAARQLEQANQRTQKELDSMIAGFQSFSPLFRGPLVNYGLKMMAKGIGYKQPKEKPSDDGVSYLAGGGDASNPMKPKGTDTQPTMLTPGEFVVNKKAAQDPENKKQLESINSGKNKKKLGNSVSGNFLKSMISQYKQGKDAKKTEYRSSGGSIGGGGSSGVGYYASGGSVGGMIAAAIVNIGSTVASIISVARSLTVTGVATTALGIAFNSVIHAVKIANQALAVFGPMVAKANPALMQKLDIVMNDLSGVIGRALIPAVEYLTPLLKKYADYVDYSMKKLTPSINKSAVAFENIASPLLDFGAVLYSVIGPVLDVLAVICLKVSESLKPIIEFINAFVSALIQTIGVLASPIVWAAIGLLIEAFDLLTSVIQETLGAIATILGAFVNLVGLLIQGLGKVISYIPLMGDVGEKIAKGGEAISKSGESLKQGKPAEQDRIKKGSSVGAAVREVSSTSISGVGDEVRKNALMAASGAKTQEEMLADISGKLSKEQLAAAFAAGLQKNPQNKAAAIVGNNPFLKGLPNPVPMQNPV